MRSAQIVTDWMDESMHRKFADSQAGWPAEEVAAAAHAIAAAKSQYWHRQRREHGDKVAFSPVRQYPTGGDGSAFSQLVNMPVHRFALPHVPGHARLQTARPVGRAAVKIATRR